MIVFFPQVPPKHDPAFLTRALDQIRGAFQQINSRRFAQDRVILAGEDGLTYRLYVDNTGTLAIEAISGNALD